MISISTGDIMHVMGGFGLQMDYTVRMKLRLTDEVDGAILAEAPGFFQGTGLDPIPGSEME